MGIAGRNGSWARKPGKALVVAALCAFAALFHSAAALAELAATGVRVGNHGDHTSFVVDLSARAAFKVFTQADPDRVVIEFPEMRWSAPPQALDGGGGLVKGYRFGFFSPGSSRLVLDVSRPVEVRKAFVLPPEGASGWRLVVNLVDADTVSSPPRTAPSRTATEVVPEPKLPFPPPRTAAVPPRPKPQPQPQAQAQPQATPPSQPAPSVSSKMPPKEITKEGDGPRHARVVAVDPGHGGEDPGATSVAGVFEKHITLAVALLLRDKLEGEGRYKVVLTRDRDVFISLRDRVAAARAAGAELFISLHADAIARRDIRGLSVYTLSEKSSDKEAAALAERENKVDLIAGVDLSHESPEVTNILINLAQRETMNLSARLSAVIIRELRREVTLLPKTHRFAGFAVLKAPDIPSVLVEMGYLSNESEELLLRTPEYRNKLTGAVARAVDKFFKQTPRGARP